MENSYIIDAARTPRGRGKIDKGALSGVHPQELFAQVLNTLQGRLGFDARDVDDVIVGCVSQVGEQGANLARNAVLAAGWPYEISADSFRRYGRCLGRDGSRHRGRRREHVACSHGLRRRRPGWQQPASAGARISNSAGHQR